MPKFTLLEQLPIMKSLAYSLILNPPPILHRRMVVVSHKDRLVLTC